MDETLRFARQTTFEHARDIIVVIAAGTGRIVDANLAAEQAYGYSRDELLALRIFDLRIDPATSVTQQMAAASASGIIFETMHRRSDGTTFPVEVSSRGGDGGLLFSIIRDITERRRLEQERSDLLATTAAALRLRDEFLAIASHELRTPVTNVDLQLQQLLRTLAKGGSTLQLEPHVHAAQREVKRLSELIGALLDAQLAKKHPIQLDRVELDLGAAIAEVADRFRVRAERIGTELILDASEIRGLWDRMRIDQIVSNLLSNALKYGAGRPVSIAVWGEAEVAHIEVRDRGIGIAMHDARRIFDRFERAVPTSYGGLGLGLYIAQQAAEAHRGTISVTSTPGVGSTFRVTLPR